MLFAVNIIIVLYNLLDNFYGSFHTFYFLILFIGDSYYDCFFLSEVVLRTQI
jgi:hypothetical protein